MKEKYRLLLAVGNDELEGEIKKNPDVYVIDSDPDIDIITDILNYDIVDYVIVNTVLSEEKSLELARKAREKKSKIIALVASYDNREFLAILAGYGVKAFLTFDQIRRIPEYIRNYPEEFDFGSLREKSKKEKPPDPFRVSENLKGKIFIGVFNICSGAGATSTAVELAENLANCGEKTICISLDGSADFEYINRKKCKAEYEMIVEEKLVAALDLIYSGMEHNVILYDFGRILDIDSNGNLNTVLAGQEVYREFLRCGYKVGLSFSDPWHDGKLKYFQNHKLGGDLSILLSGFGVEDTVKSYPQLDVYDRSELAEFIDTVKFSLGISKSNYDRAGWLQRFRPRRKIY